ncbi:MAG: polysaccharide pyruvyl transferase family protein [Eubacteriales bacterium]
MKNIIIVGGGMKNKGAQSMTFVCVDQLKERFPDDRIIMLSLVDIHDDDYNFEAKKVSYNLVRYIAGNIGILRALIKGVRLRDIRFVMDLLKDARLLVDISGYALSSFWPMPTVDYYLSYIECAKRFSIPTYILPQSFGPFYYDKKSVIYDRIGKVMQYPKIVYSREDEGYNLLINDFKLNNVKKSCDLVLQSKKIDVNNIYRKYVERILPEIPGDRVAIIPNVRNFEYIDKDCLFNTYKIIIKTLLSLGKNVFVMHHSNEDSDICNEIKILFLDDQRVKVINESFSSIEFETFVEKFDYLVASRYHAIIHSFKSGTPCIALGWASKYSALHKLFHQEDSVIDVREGIDNGRIVDILINMDDNYKKKASMLKMYIGEMQESNIFDSIVNE